MRLIILYISAILLFFSACLPHKDAANVEIQRSTPYQPDPYLQVKDSTKHYYTQTFLDEYLYLDTSDVNEIDSFFVEGQGLKFSGDTIDIRETDCIDNWEILDTLKGLNMLLYGVDPNVNVTPHIVRYKGLFDRTYMIFDDQNTSGARDPQMVYYDHTINEFSSIIDLGIDFPDNDTHHKSIIQLDASGYIYIVRAVDESVVTIYRSDYPEFNNNGVDNTNFTQTSAGTLINQTGGYICAAWIGDELAVSWRGTATGGAQEHISFTKSSDKGDSFEPNRTILSLNNNRWAYNKMLQDNRNGGVFWLVRPQNNVVNKNYYSTGIIWTKDFVNFGNWEYYASNGKYGWSKDVVANGAITEAEFDANISIISRGSVQGHLLPKDLFQKKNGDLILTAGVGKRVSAITTIDSFATIVLDYANKDLDINIIELPNVLSTSDPFYASVTFSNSDAIKLLIKDLNNNYILLESFDNGLSYEYVDIVTSSGISQLVTNTQLIDDEIIFNIHESDSMIVLGRFGCPYISPQEFKNDPNRFEQIAVGGGIDSFYFPEIGWVYSGDTVNISPQGSVNAFIDSVYNIGESEVYVDGLTAVQNGLLVNERGYVYGTNPNPTLADNVEVAGGTVGVMTDSLSGLSSSTLYYVRAYAITNYDTVYSNELSFTTNATTIEPTDISGLQLWLDASDIDGDGIEEGASESGLSGSIVNTWIDKSVNSYTFSSTGDPSQTLLVGNKAAITLDGADYFTCDQAASNFNFLHQDNSTLILRYEQDNVNNGLAITLIGNINASGSSVGVALSIGDSGGSLNLDRDMSIIVANNTTSRVIYDIENTGAFITNNNNYYNTISVVDIDGNTTDRVQIHIDNNLSTHQAVLSGSNGTPSLSDATNRLSLFLNSNGSSTFSGSATDVLIYDRDLTPQEVSDINNWLNSKNP